MRWLASAFFRAACLSSFLTGCGGVDGTAPSNPGSPTTPVTTSGAKVHVRIAANQTPVSSDDGSSRETPLDQRVGILGLELLRSADDPSPLVVFQSTSPVDTGYNAGDNTLVGTADASSLAAGTYLFARVPVAYVTFTVAGTYHEASLAIPGQFSDAISLSSNVMLDGAPRTQGWFSSTFLVDGVSEGTTIGEGASLGQPAVSSGISLDMTAPVAAYVFPVNVAVDPTVGHDVTLLFTVNTYEDFHWQDQTQPGYTAGVFDVSYGAFEPVTQLGGNSVTVTME